MCIHSFHFFNLFHSFHSKRGLVKFSTSGVDKGCVQSYVDFFYITHRKAAPKEGAPEDEVRWAAFH